MSYQIEKITSRTGLPVLKVNEFLLHSKYNPEREAGQFAEKQYKENSIHILFGFGFGYFADSLKKLFSTNDTLLIVDPICNCFLDKTTIQKYEIITDINVEFEMNLAKSLEGYKTNIKMICSPNYDKLIPTEYKTVISIIEKRLKENILNNNTVRFFAESWQENYIQNLAHVLSDRSLVELYKIYDCPIVIASGGPSLVKQLPKLKSIREKIILLAAGSTINTLLHYGIEPDYIISIDGGEGNYNHFKDLYFEKTQFIYSVRNHYKIRKSFKGNSFAFLPSIKFDEQLYIKRLTGKELPMLVGGTSVANYALSIAILMTNNDVALIGQDLAYTDNKTHAEHNRRFKIIDEKYIENRGLFYTKGYHGADVLTDMPLFTMKKSFEQISKISKEEKRLYNCTEGGVRIEGFNQISFEEFCSRIPKHKKIKPQLPKQQSHEKKEQQLFMRKLSSEINLYNELIKLLKEGLKLLKTHENKFEFNQKIIKKLNKIDAVLKENFECLPMNSIVDPITIDTLNNFPTKKNETSKEQFLRVYLQNTQLYARLLEATKISKKFTESLIERIKNN
ncbi:motility associated factor glycosyltransferase family protein [Sporosarcina highlanderae]|uniref:DUF115 domain-containing protein n=1 Tax=Sporosarcina highlanderae TaxID=3035916 RepID=A0ABT8JQF2_9BACL|nr:6-hydroxymethylpterin diphosphokinase MptE-like protein [Sporosarcina highlanderae]MDN4606796.1 DUF115 domain-containing protein [Sporosarcina highlanderae]